MKVSSSVLRLTRPLAIAGVLLACSSAPRQPDPEAGQYQVPSAALPQGVPGSVGGGVLVGVITSTCKGDPVQARIRLVSQGGDTTMAQSDERGGFTVGPLGSGPYKLDIVALLHRRASTTLSLVAGRVDTLRFILQFDDTFVHYDCLCADGRSMGAHCCKPKEATDC